MPSQLYVPGPTFIQTGTGSGGTLEHLGFTERGVRLTFDGAFEDVLTDISGTRIPFDVLYEAEQAFIAVDLNLYNEAILNKVNARMVGTYHPGGIATQIPEGTIISNTYNPGSGTILESGLATLLRSEGFMFRLLVVCGYGTTTEVAGKAAYVNMRPAYNFLTAYLDAAREIELASRVKVQRCIFRAIPNWSATVGGGTLFNFSTTGLAAIS